MRILFLSERRSILSLMRKAWDCDLDTEVSVIAETVNGEDGDVGESRFNCDFMMDFVHHSADWSKSQITMSPILPNTLGAELFLAVDKATLRPMRLELMGGAAFPAKHFANYISSVETAIREAMSSLETANGNCPGVAARVPAIRKSAFARIMVIHGDICFLYCPKEDRPIMRGRRLNIARGHDREIDIYTDGDETIGFDGWLSTEAVPSEWNLVATLGERARTTCQVLGSERR